MYIVFDNVSKAVVDDWIAQADTALGYPRGTTLHYTDALPHPLNENQYAVKIDDQLTPDLRGGRTIYTFHDLQFMGWFPGVNHG